MLFHSLPFLSVFLLRSAIPAPMSQRLHCNLSSLTSPAIGTTRREFNSPTESHPGTHLIPHTRAHTSRKNSLLTDLLATGLNLLLLYLPPFLPLRPGSCSLASRNLVEVYHRRCDRTPGRPEVPTRASGSKWSAHSRVDRATNSVVSGFINGDGSIIQWWPALDAASRRAVRANASSFEGGLVPPFKHSSLCT